MRVITISQISGAGESMFDGLTDTQTETADLIEKTFDVAGKNCVAIFNTYGITATLATDSGIGGGAILDEGGIEILDEGGGSITGSGSYTQTVSLIRDSIKDWWDYWFGPSRIGRDIVFYFPTQATSATATLKIIYTGGTAKCGLAVTGVARQLMTTQHPVEIGIDDYSRIATDGFGETYLAQGNWAKRASARLLIENTDLDLAYRDIVKNRARATIFDYNEYSYALETYHSSEDGLQSLIVYGFTEDFSIITSMPDFSTATHEAQGMV